MIYSLIKKNTYQDSVNLMLLSKSLSNIEGIEQITVMMGTEANKNIMRESNLITSEVEAAQNNDLCCVIKAEADLTALIETKIKEFFESKNNSSSSQRLDTIHSKKSIKRKLPGANLALLSIPGRYVYQEARKLLDQNLNLMIFSDNVTVAEERELKEYAQQKNLLVMGPDCGTSIISGTPLAFANNLLAGKVGIIGASGTGIQEVSAILSNDGIGISHAIGLGGRDLSEQIGGISAKTALRMLEADANTDLIVFISKPPAQSVMRDMVTLFEQATKPVVACFLGKHVPNGNGVFYEKTLAATARTVAQVYRIHQLKLQAQSKPQLLGLYCGGTLANEAAILLEDFAQVPQYTSHEQGIMSYSDDVTIIDLGDDYYTQGKPHPMIDPSIRLEALEAQLNKKPQHIVLLDNVIGYGANEQMAAFTVEMVNKHPELIFITSLTGTEQDFQIRSQEITMLEQAGVLVAANNQEAVELAINLRNYLCKDFTKAISNDQEAGLLNQPLQIVNVGLTKFLTALTDNQTTCIQFDWQPVAGGNPELAAMLEELDYE